MTEDCCGVIVYIYIQGMCFTLAIHLLKLNLQFCHDLGVFCACGMILFMLFNHEVFCFCSIYVQYMPYGMFLLAKELELEAFVMWGGTPWCVWGWGGGVSGEGKK